MRYDLFAFSVLMAKILQSWRVDPGTPPQLQPGDVGAHHGDHVQDSLRAIVTVAEVYAAESGVVSQDWPDNVIRHPAASTQVKLA